MIKRVLVLGAGGMVGNTVFKYLSLNPDIRVFGTSRENFDGKNIFQFSIDRFHTDLKQIPSTDVVINCIGKLIGSRAELDKTNTEFPKKLAEYLQKKGIKLIHISTDAVFNQHADAVDEDAIPDPEGNYNEDYSQSKLKGEILEFPHVTIRTSLLGIGKSGLLQNLIDSNNDTLRGFENQLWSGCTSLQFARLCEDIIMGQKNVSAITHSSLFHFAPIGPITKYEIVKTANEVFQLHKRIIPEKSVPITRFLISKIVDLKGNPRYTNSIRQALLELKEFYKK